MFDGTRLKMLKKQIVKKDAEIAGLKERNEFLEKENASLRKQTNSEQEKLEQATKSATEILLEYRGKIMEVGKLHQKYLQLINETKTVNDEYRSKFEDLIRLMKHAEEGD